MKASMLPRQDDRERQAEHDKLYGIAELAREFGITPRAIRFYEAKGLIDPPRAGGARVYMRRERGRLTLILRAKSMGFSLAEIKKFLDLYGNRGEGRAEQAAYVIERTAQLIEELERKQSAIVTTLEELQEIQRECLRYLALAEGGKRRGRKIVS